MTTVPRQVPQAGGVWVVDDRTTTYSALVVGRAVDVHGAWLPDVRVSCERAGTSTRSASGGQFVVAGEVTRVLPNLATATDSVPIVLHAPGRPPLPFVVPVPQGADLPVQLGDTYLPARPVAVVGQVRRLDLNQSPIAGALIRYVSEPAVPGLHPLALRTGLWGNHPAASTTVRAAAVTSLAAATTVPSGARAGDRVVTLASNAGIGLGVALRFSPGVREHYGLVREVVDGLVILAAALSASVPPGGQAQAVSVAVAGPTRTLNRAGLAGDGLLDLDADLGADVVQLVDIGAVEVHATGARSDLAGFYRLSGVRGLPVVAVNAGAAGLAGTQPATVWRVDETATNHVDLGVKP